MIMVIARALIGSPYERISTVLINKEDMESEGHSPKDYFQADAKEVEVVGEVELTGDTDELVDYAYESQ